MNKVLVWHYLNSLKEEAVKLKFTQEQLLQVKEECDDLFKQSTGYLIHPAYWISL